MTCREALWTGQIAPKGGTWKGGEEITADIVTVYACGDELAALRAFHTRHFGHPLMLLDSEIVEAVDASEAEHPLEFVKFDPAARLEPHLDSVSVSKEAVDWFDGKVFGDP